MANSEMGNWKSIERKESDEMKNLKCVKENRDEVGNWKSK